MSLDDGLDYLMRPVTRGLCRYESMIDGTLDILDFVDMNEALDVLDENAWRAQKAAESG